MSAMAGFRISVSVSNPNMLAELKARTLDLSSMFSKIYRDWADINKQKFELSRGSEASGADVFGESWAALTPGYSESKRKQGYSDWIMVRTGDLMRSMTSPDLMFQVINPQDAVFGTPIDPEDAAKVSYNWLRRPVVFLGTADKNMIRANVQAFFQFGAPFEAKLAQRTTQTQRMAEIASLDQEFNVAVSDDTGDWGNS